MRERIAIAISILAVAVLTALSVAFAVHQNPVAATPTDPADAAAGEPAAGDTPHRDDPFNGGSAAGHAVFRNWGCHRCHSVQGVGSRRFPLDGVGSRRTAGELRAWTVGSAALQDSISPSAFRAKRRYEEVPEEEMRLLLEWMGTLVQQ
jgi:cytochrome c2